MQKKERKKKREKERQKQTNKENDQKGKKNTKEGKKLDTWKEKYLNYTETKKRNKCQPLATFHRTHNCSQDFTLQVEYFNIKSSLLKQCNFKHPKTCNNTYSSLNHTAMN